MQQAIVFFDGRGVVMDGGSPRVGKGKPAGSGGKRKAIEGWTSGSRRRFREFLICHGAPAGWGCWGYTLTIPGVDVDSATPEVVGECWRQFGQTIRRAGGASPWRLELQQRQMAHFHGIMIAPSEGLKRGGVLFPVEEWVRDTWLECVDRLIPCRVPWRAVPLDDGRYRVEYMGGQFVNRDGVFRRSDVVGARRYCVKVESDGGTGAWMRYLQDHASKSKQAQEPGENWGRHWGIVARDRFVMMRPTFGPRLTAVEYARVQRHLRRFKRLRLKDERCLFGTRYGYESMRGGYGRGAAVVFTDCVLVRRLIDWARSESTPGGRAYINGARPCLSWVSRRVDKRKEGKVG